MAVRTHCYILIWGSTIIATDKNFKEKKTNKTKRNTTHLNCFAIVHKRNFWLGLHKSHFAKYVKRQHSRTIYLILSAGQKFYCFFTATQFKLPLCEDWHPEVISQLDN